jgi:trk system potassium uptake protein TrkH
VFVGISTLTYLALISSGLTASWTTFRHSIFTVASLVTTTGYANYDYVLWVPALPVLALAFLASSTLGGCAGSTSGGVKVIRLALGMQLAAREFYRLVHPRGVRPVRLASQRVDYTVVDGVASFLVLFFILGLFGAFWLSIEGFTPIESLSASLSMIANVGPSLGVFGPAGNYNSVSDLGKLMMSSLMILGRLELLTVLVLFTRDFWR